MFDLVPFSKRKKDLFGELSRTFDDFFQDDFLAPLNGNRSFTTDIRDEGDKYVIEADLPGFSKDNITVDYEDNYLTIHAERKQEEQTENDDKQVIRRERRYGQFARRFYVNDIDDSKIKGKFKDGVLHLNLPKKPGKDKPAKRIEIE